MRESAAFSYEDIDQRVCARCGLRTEDRHARPEDRFCRGCPCVDALRARIADLEFRLEKMAVKPIRPEQPERRGGRRNRRDTRFVLLDGQRLCLADAARALGVTASTLHFRLVNRTHDRNYPQNADVRALGADVAKRGANAAGNTDNSASPAA